MLRQSEIMHEIAQAAFMASKGDYDELILTLEVNIEEGWTEQTCRQIVNGEVEYLSMWDIDEPDLMNLGYELHEEMKKHTGGDLKKVTVTIDKQGKARASFEYRGDGEA